MNINEITPPGTPTTGADVGITNGRKSTSTPDSARRPPDLSPSPHFSPIHNGNGNGQPGTFRSPYVPVPPSPPLSPFPNGNISLGNGHNILPAAAPGGDRNQPGPSRPTNAIAGTGEQAAGTRTLTITNTERTSCVYTVSPGASPINRRGSRNQRHNRGIERIIDPHMNQHDAPSSSRQGYCIHGDVAFSVIGRGNTVHIHLPSNFDEEFIPLFRH